MPSSTPHVVRPHTHTHAIKLPSTHTHTNTWSSDQPHIHTHTRVVREHHAQGHTNHALHREHTHCSSQTKYTRIMHPLMLKINELKTQRAKG